MESDRHPTGTRIFYEDRRAVWRVTWTLALAFLGVAWLMQRGGALPWLLFAGVAGLLAGIGVTALFASSKPMVGVGPDGLRLYAGDVGLASGAHGDAGAFVVPWEAITSVAFEERIVRRDRRTGEHEVEAEPLCFRIAASVASPDGGRGFLEHVVGRASAMAVGEFFLWSPDERTLDLAAAPRGGFPDLTAAVARAAPRLGDASEGRRRGIGGPAGHAIYDAGLTLALFGTLALWVMGRADVIVGLAERVLAWGGAVGP